MNDTIKIPLNGRIDSGNAQQREKEIFEWLEGTQGATVVLDAQRLDFISSAGLRILLRLKKAYPKLKITNVSSEVYDILEMTGFTEIMTVEKAYRIVSVEGCEVIGEGANGRVYRIDQDNVVKTYKNADALSEIQHEREVARLALILGIPTAISYDVVRVGDSYGSVFELLDAKSFAGILSEEPERFDWCVKEYAELLRKLHATVVPEGKLPHIKKRYQNAVKQVLHHLSPEKGRKLVRMLDELPDPDTMIHGDCHTKNIVLAGDEVLLIDMDTLSIGHPLFEFAQIYNSYVGFGEYDPEIITRFQGFPAETAKKLWQYTLRAYLNTYDPAVIASVEDKVRVIAYVRLIDWSSRHYDFDNPDHRATLKLWVSELDGLLENVNSLDFEIEHEDRDSNELEVDALVENLPQVTEFVDRRLEAVGCPMKAQMQIDIAVEEIFVNIAQYAYTPNKGKAWIQISFTAEPDTAVITFMDEGVPYDPLAKPDPDITLGADERPIGGLGIFLTKKTMDEVSYRYEYGRNILTINKTIKEAFA